MPPRMPLPRSMSLMPLAPWPMTLWISLLRWRVHLATRCSVPRAFNTYVHGINDLGQIVGSYDDSRGKHGSLYMAGTFSSLDIPGGTAAIYANGINNDGQIVGFYTDSSGGTHGFLATVDMTPPVIIVSDSPATLWPPSGQLVIVTVSGTITDEPNGSGVQANSTAYRVMDEYGQIQPSGSFILAD